MSRKLRNPSSLVLATGVLPVVCSAEPIDAVDPLTDTRAGAAVMLGHWEYQRPVPPTNEPSLNAGLMMGFEIDSVAGVSFFGRVSFWFAGDVGVPSDLFGPVTGTTNEASQVSLVIQTTGPAVPAIRLGAELHGDRLVVQGSWCGDEAGPFPGGSAFVRAVAGT